MAEITINGVKYTNVPNKKAGTKFAASLTQSNIGASQAVQDYVNSAYFYPLVNAIDINWNGVEVDENSYINSTSDLITYIASKESSVDLTSYATKNYVDQKIEDVIGGAPDTLDTLKELADALADEASLAYVTEALSGKANVADVYDKTSVDNLLSGLNSTYASISYVTTELDKKADLSDIPSAPDLTPYATVSYVTSELDKKADKTDIPSMPDLTPYATTSYVTTELDKKADKSSLNDYATNSYVTIELDKKADKTDIPVVPDMTNYVTMTSYNMLVQRVDELANLIAYYHPATPGPGPGPTPTPTFEGYWTYNGMRTDSLTVNTTDPIMTLSFVSNPTISSGIGTWTFKDSQPGISINTMTGEMTINPSMLMSGMVYSGVGYDYSNNGDYHSLYITINVSSGKQMASGYWLNSMLMQQTGTTVAAGDSTTYTFTFNGTPSDNWSFTYMADVSGVSFDSMTGTITIDVSNSVESTTRYMYLNASRQEDSTYMYGSAAFNVKVLPNGTNPDFYFDETSVHISNTVGTMTPMLYNSLGACDHVGYVSSDTSIATVNNDRSINYVSDGTCTVTATAYDINNNVLATATIAVICETMKNWPFASWSGTNMNLHAVVNAGNSTPVTYMFSGTPLSGWTAQTSPDAGITINSSTMDVTIDATNMATGEYTVNVSYPEDANYNAGIGSLWINIIPAGADPNFYFTFDSVTLSPSDSPRYNGIQNNIGYQVDHVSFVSDDTSIVTVNNTSMAGTYQCELNWQGEGTATIVATAYDSSNNVLATASMNVTCTAAAPVLITPTGSWTNTSSGIDYGTDGEGDTGWTVDEERTDTFTFKGSPASGWTFNYPTGTGITANTTTGEITIDTSVMTSKGTYTFTASYPGDSTYSSATKTFTVTIEKLADASWKDINDVIYSNQYDMNINDNGTTLTFNGTPSTGWTFSGDDEPGIIVSESTGEIIIDPVPQTPDTYWITAEYLEDAIYSHTYKSFAIVVNDNA